MYLDFLEDESIPDTVPPHDAFQHLCLLPPVSESQQPALHRGVGLPKDLQRYKHEGSAELLGRASASSEFTLDKWRDKG